MNILIFAAKLVGDECTKFLLNNFSNDHYEIVACPGDEPLIETTAASFGVLCRRLSPEVISEVNSRKDVHYDWLLNLWGGHIFQVETLAKATNSLNIHPSYLPLGRGRDPIVWSVRDEIPAGATLHQLSQGVDEGPIWCQKRIDYAFPTTGAELYGRVVDACIELFCQNWANIRAGKIPSKAQPNSPQVTTKKRTDLLLDQIVDLDADAQARQFVLKALAHDFGPEYTLKVTKDGRTFDMTLNIRPAATSKQENKGIS